MPKQRGRFRSRRFDRKRFLAYQVVGFFAACLLLHVGYNSDKYLPTSVTQAAGLRGSGNVIEESGTDAASRKLLQDFPPEKLLNGDKPDYSDSTNKYVLILHSIGIIYMFVGLAVVCDDYFVAALEEMCEKWNITEDVAGATFMAAGGSAPELFTSLLGVFVAESDVGFGTIVGSAVFNVLFVIGLCALFAKQVLELTWWPLARDCTYYTFGLLVLIACVQDNEVHWYEAAVLLLCYIGYVVLMKYNVKVKHWLESKPCCSGRAKTAPESDKGVEMANAAAAAVAAADQEAGDKVTELPSAHKTLKAGPSLYHHHHALAAENEAVRFRDYRSQTLRAIVHGHLEELNQKLIMAGGGTELERSKSFRYRTAWSNTAKTVKNENPSLLASQSETGLNDQVVPVTDAVQTLDDPSKPAPRRDSTGADTPVHQVTTGDANTPIDLASFKENGDDEDDDSLWDIPESCGGKALWVFALPVNFVLWLTIPDCKKDKYRSWFLATFILSLVWIAAFSYFMVWWASTFGFALGIPAPVMGLTILAGGTSIPDALSSVIVARNGFGDMAVSSSIGSNIFDINVGLPLPWLIKTAIVSPGESVPIASCGMAILSVSLLVMVLFVVLSIKFSGWRLNMKLGGIMFVLYLLFVTESLLLEYDVLVTLSC